VSDFLDMPTPKLLALAAVPCLLLAGVVACFDASAAGIASGCGLLLLVAAGISAGGS